MTKSELQALIREQITKIIQEATKPKTAEDQRLDLIAKIVKEFPKVKHNEKAYKKQTKFYTYNRLNQLYGKLKKEKKSEGK